MLCFHFEALGNIRHEKVRRFALELAKTDRYTNDVISMLVQNYRKSELEVLSRLVESLPVTYTDESGWHGSFLGVRRIFEKRGQKDVPRELLPYLYENTWCSCCRESVLMEIGRRHMVTNELLQECIYDSNEEIRRYAVRRLKLGKNSKI